MKSRSLDKTTIQWQLAKLIGLSKLINRIEKNERNGIRRILRAILQHHFRMAFTITAQVLSAALEGGSIAMLGLAVNVLVDAKRGTYGHGVLGPLSETLRGVLPSADTQTIFILLVTAAIFAQILKSCLSYIATLSSIYLSTAIQMEVGNKATLHTMSLSYSSLGRYQSGTIAALVDNTSVIPILILTLSSLTLTVFMLSSYLTIALSMSMYYGIIVLVAGILILKIAQSIGRRLRKYAAKEMRGNVDVWRHMFEYLNAPKLLRVYNKVKQAGDIVNDARNRQILSGRRASAIQNIITPITEIFVILGVATVLLGGILLTENPVESAPMLLVYTLVIYRAFPYITRLSQIQLRFIRALPRLGYVESYLNMEDKQFDRVTGEPFSELKKEIVFHNVCYRYPTADHDALNGVTLTIPKGSTIALIGKSGAGKTTLTDLITGIYDPTSGKIFVDDCDLSKISLVDWRENIGVVDQEVFLFNASIRENISFSRVDASFEEIVIAAELAGADAFIEQLPERYETIIGDRGFKLSGGEKQRISLARALFKNPRLLILDEATNALDTVSEQIIQRTIERMHGERTIILIAHRLSTIEKADWIVAFEGGRIIEEGTKEDLLNQEGYFANIWRRQHSDAG